MNLAFCLNAKGGSGRIDGESETFLPVATSLKASGKYDHCGDESRLVVAHTLRADGFDASEDGTGRGTPLVFDERNITSKGNRSVVEAGRECHTLHEVPPAVAFNWQAGGSKAMVGGTNEYADALQSSQVTATLNGTGVRRLTPRECERLQGFPDDWTRWDADGNELSDSPRYRMMGNAVSVPPVEWIGRRIVEANQ